MRKGSHFFNGVEVEVEVEVEQYGVVRGNIGILRSAKLKKVGVFRRFGESGKRREERAMSM